MYIADLKGKKITGQGAIAPLRTRGAPADNPTASVWLDHVLEIYALFMFCGIISTLLIKETKRKTLEELADDNDYASSGYTSSGPNHTTATTTGRGGGVFDKSDVVQSTAAGSV